MVINHLEKLFVTNDAATILRELEVRYIPLMAKQVYDFVNLYIKQITCEYVKLLFFFFCQIG